MKVYVRSLVVLVGIAILVSVAILFVEILIVCL